MQLSLWYSKRFVILCWWNALLYSSSSILSSGCDWPNIWSLMHNWCIRYDWFNVYLRWYFFERILFIIQLWQQLGRHSQKRWLIKLNHCQCFFPRLGHFLNYSIRDFDYCWCSICLLQMEKTKDKEIYSYIWEVKNPR